MKITAQDYIILAILDCLDDTIQGMGVRNICDVDYELNNNGSWIEIKRKDGKEMEAKDAFWLGYLVREYV